MEIEAVIGGCNRNSASLDYNSGVIAFASGKALLKYDSQTHNFLTALRSHTDKVNSVKIIDPTTCVSGSSDKTVKLWVNDVCQATYTMEASVVCVTVSQRRVAAIDISGTVAVLVMTETGLEVEGKFKIKKSLPESVAISPAGLLCVGSCDASIYVYTFNDGSWVFNVALTAHKKTITALDFNTTGDLLASSSIDTSARVWRVYDSFPQDVLEQQGHFPLIAIGKSIKVDALLTSHTGPVSSIRWVGDQLVTASHDCSIILWETDRRTGVWLPQAVLGQLGGCRHTFYGVVASEVGIVSNSYNGTVFHWARAGAEWKLMPAISGHIGPVTDIAIGEGFIVTASQDQTARLYAIHGGQWHELSRPLVHGHDLNCISLTKLNLITGGDEKILRLFDPSNVTSELLAKLTDARLEGQVAGAVQALGLTNKASDTRIEIPNEPPTEDFLSTSTLWPEVFKLYGHGYEVTAVASYHPLLASACNARTTEEAEIIIWDIEGRRKTASLSCHSLTVTQLEFSPNGRQLLSVSRARSWGLHTQGEDGWTTQMFASAHERMIYACTWINDEAFLTASRDKFIKVWRTDSSLQASIKFKQPVTACAVVSTAVFIAGLEDGTVAIHNLETSDQTSSKFQSGAINRIRVDGARVYVASADHTLTVLKL
mmetsp:Transcript_13971/g.26159  ORF Transcript_13971/g.26159 Transcript_13971/m.26159 type:complete len:656 (-) Transcript_13971:60-2027(-)